MHKYTHSKCIERERERDLCWGCKETKFSSWTHNQLRESGPIPDSETRTSCSSSAGWTLRFQTLKEPGCGRDQYRRYSDFQSRDRKRSLRPWFAPPFRVRVTVKLEALQCLNSCRWSDICNYVKTWVWIGICSSALVLLPYFHFFCLYFYLFCHYT